MHIGSGSAAVHANIALISSVPRDLLTMHGSM